MQVATEFALAIVVVNFAAFEQQMADAEIENACPALRAGFLLFCRRQIRVTIFVRKNSNHWVLDTDITDIPLLVQ